MKAIRTGLIEYQNNCVSSKLLSAYNLKLQPCGLTFEDVVDTINDIYRTIYGTQVDISSLDYLKAAMAQNTLIANGLILTSNISLGETISDVFQIRAGINGTMPDGVTNPIMWCYDRW